MRLETARRFALACALTVAVGGCGKEDLKFFYEKKPIPDLPYQGFRRDIPAERRGNAVFDKAVFTRDGKYLVTVGNGIRVFDATSGALLRLIRAGLDGNDLLVVDSEQHVLLARDTWMRPDSIESRALYAFDVVSGARTGPFVTDTGPSDAQPIGITPSGEAVVLRGGLVEFWGLDGSGPRRSVAPWPMHRFCRSFELIEHDKRCHELSRSGRWLILTADDTSARPSKRSTYLIDVPLGAMRRIALPGAAEADGGEAFAFSPDERMLALQVGNGMWLDYPLDSAPTWNAPVGRLVRSDQPRTQSLKPITYSPDGRRVVAVGTGHVVTTYDVSADRFVGSSAPPFEEREGVVRVSADGSRAIAYRYIADILVVIDGATGRQLGYVCPYFCNRAHNPVLVPYAVSPDGRRVATGGRLGAGLWDVAADTLIAPLRDPAMPPLRPQ